jgi:hypothetical protein
MAISLIWMPAVPVLFNKRTAAAVFDTSATAFLIFYPDVRSSLIIDCLMFDLVFLSYSSASLTIYLLGKLPLRFRISGRSFSLTYKYKSPIIYAT